MESQQVQNKCSLEVVEPIRVFLVDDNPHFLELVATLLRKNPWLKVVGQALSGREALAAITTLRPDLLLIDVAMPGINGLELTWHIKKRPHAPRVLIVTTYDDPEYRRAAEMVKADGFVVKADVGLNLLPAIRALF